MLAFPARNTRPVSVSIATPRASSSPGVPAIRKSSTKFRPASNRATAKSASPNTGSRAEPTMYTSPVAALTPIAFAVSFFAWPSTSTVRVASTVVPSALSATRTMSVSPTTAVPAIKIVPSGRTKTSLPTSPTPDTSMSFAAPPLKAGSSVPFERNLATKMSLVRVPTATYPPSGAAATALKMPPPATVASPPTPNDGSRPPIGAGLHRSSSGVTAGRAVGARAGPATTRVRRESKSLMVFALGGLRSVLPIGSPIYAGSMH